MLLSAAAAVVCCLAVAVRGLGEPFLLVSLDESVQEKKALSAGPGFRHEYPTVTLDDAPRESMPGSRSFVVQQPQLESFQISGTGCRICIIDFKLLMLS